MSDPRDGTFICDSRENPFCKALLNVEDKVCWKCGGHEIKSMVAQRGISDECVAVTDIDVPIDSLAEYVNKMAISRYKPQSAMEEAWERLHKLDERKPLVSVPQSDIVEYSRYLLMWSGDAWYAYDILSYCQTVQGKGNRGDALTSIKHWVNNTNGNAKP